MKPTDLAAELFVTLRLEFFDTQLRPLPYTLRGKANTQDDPFDENLQRLLVAKLPQGIECIKARGPLITPDIVLQRRDLCAGQPRSSLRADTSRIIGLEVKKLERSPGGKVARNTGLDYNTTPPCGTVRVYDEQENPLEIRGFYLFVCQEPSPGKPGNYFLSSLVLCDGNLLNEDFQYYLSIVGERKKQIGLGTFGDGADRCRPMLIFTNPLGCERLQQEPTLVHSTKSFPAQAGTLRRIGQIRRRAKDGSTRLFHCFGLASDYKETPSDGIYDLADPFPTPRRSEKTQPRGRFKLDFRTTD
jgi:hypothetical protein